MRNASLTRARGKRSSPPYGRDLADLLRGGMRPANGVMVHLDRWPREMSTVFFTIVLPGDISPDSCDWSCLKGLDVWVRHQDAVEERVAATLAAILRHDPRQLTLIEGRGNQFRLVGVKRFPQGIVRAQLDPRDPQWRQREFV